MLRNRILGSALLVAALTLAGCGTKQSAVKTDANTGATTQTAAQSSKSTALQQLAFMQTVSDQKVYTQNITGNMNFTARSGDKDISLSGSLKMRKDKVIRLSVQIPIIGSEAARLEFTPTYVLVVDRIHREYYKADYTKLDFLRDNGLNFYSLQALFWNQLLLPGSDKVSESDLKKFAVNLGATGTNLPITLQQGNMNYQWQADRKSGRIQSARVQYKSQSHGTSTLDWTYGDFRPVGVKQFPARQEFTISTSATRQPRKATVIIEMNDVKTDSKWDAETTLSDRYKKVEDQDVLGKLLSM